MTLEDLDNLRALTRHPGWALLRNDLEALRADCFKRWTDGASESESRDLQAKARAITWLLERPQKLIEDASEATIEQDPARG